MTDAESLLWRHLRAKRFQSYKFRRQHPVGKYIVDFVCLKHKLIIELDGGQHAKRVEYDTHRTLYLKQNKFNVLRFWNNEVLENTEGVLQAVVSRLNILMTDSILEDY